MNVDQLIRHRMAAQQLATQTFSDPAQTVEWMGVVQAQDYAGSLWAVGMRCKGISIANVEEAIANKSIIRSWPMRGTLHYVAPQYTRWMLKYLTPRVVSRAASIYRQLELNEKVFAKSARVLTKALEGNRQLTRAEMYDALDRDGISTGDSRGLHITGYLAQQGLICLSARQGKQPAFALLEEWIPSFAIPPQDEAFAILCNLYFRSHGPASIGDFMWWSGLTKKEATQAIADNRGRLSAEKFAGDEVFFIEGKTPKKVPRIILTPHYDEYTVAYKDRSAVADAAALKKAGSGLTSCLIIDGRIAGTWKRTISRKGVELEVKCFSRVSAEDKAGIKKTAERYGSFLGLDAHVRL